MELLLLQVCQGDVQCEDAYKLHWPPVSDTLFGLHHVRLPDKLDCFLDVCFIYLILVLVSCNFCIEIGNFLKFRTFFFTLIRNF